MKKNIPLYYYLQLSLFVIDSDLKFMKKKIMLIDDKETIAKVLFVYLSAEYDCVYFENPVKAIDYLTDGNIPDLIITDLRMPEMRGDAFLSYIKSNQLFKYVPVIILSSEDSSTERIRLLENGAEDYIIKPFNPMELKIRINKIEIINIRREKSKSRRSITRRRHIDKKRTVSVNFIKPLHYSISRHIISSIHRCIMIIKKITIAAYVRIGRSSGRSMIRKKRKKQHKRSENN